MATVNEIFAQLNAVMKAEPGFANGQEAVYQFNLTGDDAGIYQIILQNEGAFCESGTTRPADCTLTMDANDFKDMIAGDLSGTGAFMAGKLKVEGDLSLALRLETILNAYASR